MKSIVAIVMAVWVSSAAVAQTTRPTTRPTGKPNPDEMMNRLLGGQRTPPPLRPTPDPVKPEASRIVRPGAPAGQARPTNLIREGTIIAKRVGRLRQTPDGQAEFLFEADGKSLQDPPMLILPNLNLMDMETMVKNASRDVKFRISGTVTEYRSRNYILIEAVVSAESDTTPPPQAQK